VATLLVSDTSVLVDLERGGILETFFKLSFDIGVPDVLYEEELKGWDGPDLIPFGLKVLTLTDEGVALAQRYQDAEQRLSLSDAFALALAKTGDHVLLAGDASLRALAEKEKVDVHGILWVFDLLEEGGLATPAELVAALTAIVEHPRCRLPKTETRQRLERYRKHPET